MVHHNIFFLLHSVKNYLAILILKMIDMHKKKIQQNLHNLASNTSNLSQLTNLLLQKRVLGINEHENLNLPGQTKYKINTDLYLTILRKDNDAFHILIQCLKSSSNEHVAEILENETPATCNSNESKAPMIWFGFKKLSKSYVERSVKKGEMLAIWNDCLDKDPRAHHFLVITGMGGIGKTELATQFAHHVFIQHKAHCIFIDGENYETQLNSYLKLTSNLAINLKDRINPNLNSIVEEIQEKLSGEKCVYILDNVMSYDDPLITQFLKMIEAFPPDSLRPFVIITSRMSSVEKSFGNTAVHLPLPSLTPEEAYQLISGSLAMKNNETRPSREEIENICRHLKNHPLALQQAVASINADSRNSNINFEIQKVNKMLENGTYMLLTNPLPLHQQQESSKSSTYQSLKISLENMEKYLGNDAVKIMKIISFFYSDDISIEMLTQILLHGVSTSSIENRECVLRICKVLSDHSMCTINTESMLISVDRLLQEVVLIDLKKKNNLLEESLQDLLNATKTAKIVQSTEKANKTNLTTLRSVWHHALKSTQDQHLLLLSHLDFPGSLAEKYDKFGEFRVCELLTSVTLEKIKLLPQFPDDHPNFPDILWLRYWRGCALEGTGKLEEAFDVLRDTFEKAKVILGGEDDLTLRCAHVIGTVLWNQKRNAEALDWYLLGLESRKTNFGDEHEQTIVLRNDIALILADDGQYEEALSIFKDNFTILTRTLGAYDSETLTAKHNIGWMKFCQREYCEALEILEKLLEEKLFALPVNHPDVFSTKHLLARTLKEIGRNNWEKAAQFFREAYEGRRCVLGTHHEKTTNSLTEFETTMRDLLRKPDNQGSLQKIVDNINKFNLNAHQGQWRI